MQLSNINPRPHNGCGGFSLFKNSYGKGKGEKFCEPLNTDAMNRVSTSFDFRAAVLVSSSKGNLVHDNAEVK
ncbi:hypothetical protein NIES37_58990 [Tolypothrix tenuis PCC 7101]|uniref:Uncharacterized protein n=1 Tax=Tolypothrix tenuis PCC 7101 TaxID=231146 RepID=A0A1Z4N8B3_9CYAN|nr:hypothetical protein NIES37_58990 [Tolypothrix tenuis PCC 7101]BAZ74183.1 hypothetical protein NIES50_27540 [Aulosira laxa NIES-50]